jgi:hypothetical protein
VDHKELATLFGVASSAYPNLQKADLSGTLNVWEMMLSDLSFDAAKNALIRVMSTSKFFPTVAEIREAVMINTSPVLPTAAEGYEEVLRAIGNFGSWREQAALDSLSPLVRRTTEVIGFKQICLSESPDVIRGQWRMAYEQIAERAMREGRMPEALRRLPEERNLQLESAGQLMGRLRLVKDMGGQV